MTKRTALRSPHFKQQGLKMLNTSSWGTAVLQRWLLPAMALAIAWCAAMPAHADLKSVGAEVAKLYSNARVSETIFKDLYRIDFGPNSAPFYVGESVSLILETDGQQVTNWVQPVQKPMPITEEDKSGVLNAILRNVRFDKLIQIKQGKGTQQILLVSAYDCPFCIQLERMLSSAGDKVDATFYIVPSTLNHRDKSRQENVHNIWCANDNAATWRNGLLKAAQQYPASATVAACTLGDADWRDMYIVLRSLGVKDFAYPFMLSDNGLPTVAEQELPPFLKQIRNGAEKKFWSAQNRALYPAVEYAQFRADKAGPRGWYK